LHERGHAVVIDDAWICTLGDEQREDICCTRSCCLNKRRAAMAVACVDICPAPNKRLGCAEVTCKDPRQGATPRRLAGCRRASSIGRNEKLFPLFEIQLSLHEAL